MQHSQSQADHLQILGSGRGADVPGSGSHVVNDALLKPWDEEVSSLTHDLILNTRETIKDDGASTALDIVDGLICE